MNETISRYFGAFCQGFFAVLTIPLAAGVSLTREVIGSAVAGGLMAAWKLSIQKPPKPVVPLDPKAPAQ